MVSPGGAIRGRTVPFPPRAVSYTGYPGERLYGCFRYIPRECVSIGLRSASVCIGFSPSISASHAALSRYICDMARSKVIVVPQIQAWEDEFPGVKGDRFSWFADEPAAAAPPQGGVPATLSAPTLSALPAAPQNAPVGQVPPDATLHASGPTQAPLPLLPPPSPSQDSPASTTLPAASPAAPRDPATLPSVSFPQGGGISGGAQTKDTGLEGSYWTKPPSGSKRQTC